MQFQHRHTIISKNPLVLMSNNTPKFFNLWPLTYSKNLLLLLMMSAILISGLITSTASAANTEDSIQNRYGNSVFSAMPYTGTVIFQWLAPWYNSARHGRPLVA